MNFRPTVAAMAILSSLAAVPALAADKYEVDPAHSSLVFRIQHLGVGYVWGNIDTPTGTVVIDEADLSKSSIQIEAKVENIDTGNAKRDEHLRGPDFFNGKQFPTLSFKSTKIEKASDKAWTVTGDLTINGATKPVTLTLNQVGTTKDPWGNIRTGFEGEFTIKRADFGVNYMPDGLGADVKIIVAFEATRPS